MLALMLMMPLLCVYADLVGMLAGLVVARGCSTCPWWNTVHETRQAVDLVDCGVGLVKSAGVWRADCPGGLSAWHAVWAERCSGGGGGHVGGRDGHCLDHCL